MKINSLCQLQRKDIGKTIQSLSFYTIKCVILHREMMQNVLPFGTNCSIDILDIELYLNTYRFTNYLNQRRR